MRRKKYFLVYIASKKNETITGNTTATAKYIDFEAKESHNKTAFPLANIHPHQIEHLKRIIAHGGIGFFIF